MSRPRKPQPKLADVALRAGVSPATVSRFYNNPAVVREETAVRIRAAIAATGYVPNVLAGSLASNRSRLVAVMVPEVAHSIFNDTIEAMCEELSRDGNVVMLALTGPDNARMPALIDAALARRAEAIILTGVLSDAATRRRLRERDTMVIETWGLPKEPIDVAVGFSHEAVGRAVARFARERGYRRPHLVVGDGLRARQRRAGFIAEWTPKGGAAKLTEQVVPIPARFGHGRLVWRGIGELDQRPDIVVCGSDVLAQGLVVEAQAAGLRVPDDLAVMGFGNMVIAGEMRPTLTTVDVDGARIGREAVSLLRRRASGEKLPSRLIDVGFRIIARESA